MNEDKIAGIGKDLTGKVKEGFGKATGDSQMQGDGLIDQVGGAVQKTYGDAREAISSGTAPLIDELKRFASERPVVAATVVAVLGVALINTLRGR